MHRSTQEERIVLKEFKEFINKGNLIDVAVAFVLGLAFANVVTALTTRIVAPLIGMIFSVSDLDAVGTFGNIDEATGLPTGSFGAFIAAVLNFLIVAFVMFLVVKAYNRMKAPVTEAPADTPEDIALLREIRDSLNK
jgi:large conductance mechanosensitive channel